MLIPTKKYYLLFSLLLLNLHTVNSFFSHNPFTSKSYTDYQQSQLLNTYLTKLQQNLNGLPSDEIIEIINKTKIELEHIDLRYHDTVELTIRSVLIAHAENKINREISAYEIQKDIKFDQDIHELIKNNRRQAFINCLSELSVITGNDIKNFFGDFRTNAIQKVCDTAAEKQQSRQNSYPSAPPAPAAPQSAPPAPLQPQSNNIYLIQKHRDEYTTDYLFKIDIDYLNDKLSNSSKDDFLENAKKEIKLLLSKKLQQAEEELKKEGSRSPSDIQNAIDETRAQKRKDINKLKKIDATKIAEMIGNSPDGLSNVKSAVYDNLSKNRR